VANPSKIHFNLAQRLEQFRIGVVIQPDGQLGEVGFADRKCEIEHNRHGGSRVQRIVEWSHNHYTF
jgi:hypothetical protein